MSHIEQIKFPSDEVWGCLFVEYVKPGELHPDGADPYCDYLNDDYLNTYRLIKVRFYDEGESILLQHVDAGGDCCCARDTWKEFINDVMACCKSKAATIACAFGFISGEQLEAVWDTE